MNKLKNCLKKIINQLATFPRYLFYSGNIILALGLFFLIFLKTTYFSFFINFIQGHQVSLIGFDKINRLYLQPTELFFITSGLLMILASVLLKFKKITHFIFSLFQSFWQKIKSLPLGWLLLILFGINFLIRFVLLLASHPLSIVDDGVEYINVATSLLHNQGLSSHIIDNLQLKLPSSIPYPIALFPPIYPILIFFSFKIFGWGFISAGLVNILLASVLPLLIYFLTWRLTNSKKTALIAALLMSFNRIFLGWSTQILTEIPYTFFTILFFIFLTASAKIKNLALTGLFLGLTFLTRFQAIVILTPIILFYQFKNNNFKNSLKNLILIFSCAFLTILPWLIRNYLVFGQPLYLSASLSSWLNNYQSLPAETIAQAPSPLLLIKENIIKIISHVISNLFILIAKTPYQIIGSFSILLAALIGWLTAKKQNLHRYNFLIIYLLLHYLFIAFFKPLPRYIYALTPIFIFFAALGFWALVDWCRSKNFIIMRQIIIIFFSFSLLLTFIYGCYDAKQYGHQPQMSILSPSPVLAAQKANNYLKNHSTEIKTVMIASRQPRYLGYFMPETNILIFPTNYKDFLFLINRFQVNYVVLPYLNNSNYEPSQAALPIINQYQNKEIVWQSEQPKIIIYRLTTAP